jgi:hypothetical protein
MTEELSPRKLRLSGRGLANIAESKKQNDFTFIVSGHRYDCPWFVADFLSPRVGRLHENDPSASELVIDTSDRQGQFPDFLSLGRGDAISLTSSNRSFILSVAAELENFDIYWLVRADFPDEMNCSSFCSDFADLHGFDCPADRVISFIASHFCEIDESFLIRLPISTLKRVLSHDSLRIKSEDSLYAFVISVLNLCAESVSLLEQIRFEYLSSDAMDSFVLWSFDHFDQIYESFSLWKAICVRLSLTVSDGPANPRADDRSCASSVPKSAVTIRTFSPSTYDDFNGIISHLTREHDGNVHDQGIVDISAKSIYLSAFAKYAADIESTVYFHSKNDPGQWLCYDFKNRRVRPTHYSIRFHSGHYYPRSWVLEGSNDGSSWVVLDSQTTNLELNLIRLIDTFSVSHTVECRFVRLRQTGTNAGGSYYVVLSAFELFGELIES